MPPSAEPWIAVAAVCSSMAMVFSFVRVWRRRIERADRLRERERNRPVADPFKVAMSHEGHRRLRDSALVVPPLEPLGEVAWSAAFGDDPDAWLYLEDAVEPRLIGVARGVVRVGIADAEHLTQTFGVRPEIVVQEGLLYVAINAGQATSPFDQLCLVAAAVEAAAPVPTGDKVVAVACSWFDGGVEHGALPPFGRIEHDPMSGALVLNASNRLHYRQEANPRVEFGRWSLPLSSEMLRAAVAAMPADVLAPGPIIRVIGGEPALLVELAERG